MAVLMCRWCCNERGSTVGRIFVSGIGVERYSTYARVELTDGVASERFDSQLPYCMPPVVRLRRAFCPSAVFVPGITAIRAAERRLASW